MKSALSGLESARVKCVLKQNKKNTILVNFDNIFDFGGPPGAPHLSLFDFFIIYD